MVNGDDPKWFSVSLRVFGDALDPHGVSPLLGLEADAVGIKGLPREGRSGRKYAPYKTNLWLYDVKLHHSIGFDEKIRTLFEDLGDRINALHELCQRDGIEGDLFCGYCSDNGQGGDILLPSTLRFIVEAGLSLHLDLYPPDSSEGVVSPAKTFRDLT